MRFEVLTVRRVWGWLPCSLVEVQRRFRGDFCHHHIHISPKRLHGAKSIRHTKYYNNNNNNLRSHNLIHAARELYNYVPEEDQVQLVSASRRRSESVTSRILNRAAVYYSKKDFLRGFLFPSYQPCRITVELGHCIHHHQDRQVTYHDDGHRDDLQNVLLRLNTSVAYRLASYLFWMTYFVPQTT